MRRLFVVLIVLVALAAVWFFGFRKTGTSEDNSPTPVSSMEDSPKIEVSTSPATATEVEMPSEVINLYSQLKYVSTTGLFVKGEFVADMGKANSPVVLLKGEEEVFVALSHKGSMNFYRTSNGKTVKFKETPAVSDGRHTFRIIEKDGWMGVELDDAQVLSPVVTAGHSSVWTVKGIGARALTAPYFMEKFSRTEGNGEWRIEGGSFSLVSFDFSDKSVNPGYLTVESGKPQPVKRSEYVLADARTGKEVIGVGIIIVDNGFLCTVGRLNPFSPASEAGISEGDEIVSINGKKPSVEYFNEVQSQEGKPVTIRWMGKDKEKHNSILVPRSLKWGGMLKETRLNPIKAAEESRILVDGEDWIGYFIEANMRITGEGTGGIIFRRSKSGEVKLFPLGEAPHHKGGWYYEDRRGTPVFLGGSYPGENSWFSVTVRMTSFLDADLIIDGLKVAEFRPDAPFCGGIGLFAKGDVYVDFDDIRVGDNSEYREFWQQEDKFESFASVRQMEQWADGNRGFVEDKILWLDDGPFVTYELTLSGSSDFSVLLNSKNCSNATLVLNYSSNTEKFELVSNDSSIAQNTVAPNIVAAGITVFRLEDKVKVLAGEVELLSAEVKKEADLSYVGIRADGDSNTLRAQVTAKNLFIDNFTSAPVGWAQLSGAWGVTSRWSCDPRWSYFGGYSDDIALVTSKYKASGDRYIDFFFAPPMISHETPYDKHSGFLIGFTNNPVNPWSGYVVQVGTDDGRGAVLYRNGVEVDSTEIRAFADSTHNVALERVHDWSRARLEITGSRVTLVINKVPLITYEDPKPLESGFAVLGALANGILLSRVHFCARSLEPTAFACSGNTFPMPEFSLNPLGASAILEEISNGVRVNCVSTAATPELNYLQESVNLFGSPFLHFFISVNKAPVDLYFECEGRNFKVNFSGIPDNAEDAQSVAWLVLNPDGHVTEIKLNLLDAVSVFFPGKKKLGISNIHFGFHGKFDFVNKLQQGAWYSVAVFRLGKYPSSVMPPAVSKVVEPYQNSSDGEVLTVIFEDAYCPIIPSSASITIDGSKHRVDGRRIKFDSVRKKLEVFVGRLELAGGEHEIEITGLKNVADGVMKPWKSKFTIDKSKDNLPPETSFRGIMFNFDFDEIPSGVFPDPDSVPLTINNWNMSFPTTQKGAGFCMKYGDAADGIGYLRVYNRDNGGSFGLGLIDQEIDLLACPVFSFAWRMYGKQLPLDLVIQTSNRQIVVPLSRFMQGESWKWNRSSIDLSAFINCGEIATRVTIADTNYQGIERGTFYDLDSISFGRVISADRFPEITAFDCSSDAKVYVGIDEQPETLVENLEVSKKMKGIHPVYWKAVDSVGNETAILCKDVLFDSEKPGLGFAERSGRTMTFQLSDNYGIISASIVVTLSSGLTYTMKKGISFKGGNEYTLELPDERSGEITITAADYAGNRMTVTSEFEDEPEEMIEEEEEPVEEEDEPLEEEEAVREENLWAGIAKEHWQSILLTNLFIA